MTPPRLDAATVQARLRLMRDLLDDLASAGDVTGERLRRGRLLRHAVERVLTQLVELATSINSHLVLARTGRAPQSYRESFVDAAAVGALPQELAQTLAPAVGMRNLLVHEYTEIDIDKVAEAVPGATDAVGAYVSEVATWLGDQPDR